MADCESAEASHGSMNGILGELSAHDSIITISHGGSDHVGRINVFKSYFHRFLFAVFVKFIFDQRPDVLRFFVARGIYRVLFYL